MTQYGWMELPWMTYPWMTPVEDTAQGVQVDARIDGATSDLGVQVDARIDSGLTAIGVQAESAVVNFSGTGVEVTQTRYPHRFCESGWMNQPWMTYPWMTPNVCVGAGVQIEAGIVAASDIGAQVDVRIDEASNDTGVQVESVIFDEAPIGVQVAVAGVTVMGVQINIRLYNTNNLRILCAFPSRGVSGNNWTASTTASGDFDVNNVNTDIVEQRWQSANLSSQIITCDAQTPIFVDTLGILEHNFTASSTVVLQASEQSNFSTIGLNETITWTQQDMFWISELLPKNPYRYWRLVIDDVTNPDGHVYVGSVVFGSADILQGECFTDNIQFGFIDFVDKINTEGFTNVSNSRALKRTLGLSFRNMQAFGDNFQIMRNLFQVYRTSHKCLWIPTPQYDDPDATARYALFSKLARIPNETHHSPDNKIDYTDFSIDLDESL